MKLYRILALLLAMLTVLSVIAFASCDKPDEPNTPSNPDNGENEDENGGDDEDGDDSSESPQEGDPVTYTVTVKDIDGNPVVGARVQICNDTTCHGLPRITNENGIAVIDNIPFYTQNKVQVSSVPTGYILPSDGQDGQGNNIPIKFPITDFSATVTIGKEPDGSAENPFFIGELTMSITVPAGASHHYFGKNIGGYTVSIADFSNGKINVGALEALPDGSGDISIELPIDSENLVSYSTVIITNTGSADATVTLVVTPPPGSIASPIVLSSLGEKVAVITSKLPTLYYEWTATVAGTFTVTTDDLTAGINLGGTVYQATQGQTSIVATITVQEGDTVKFNLGVNTNSPTELIFTVAFVPAA